MTLQEIQDAVAHIRAIAVDDEAAHATQDRLVRAVLTYIAEGNEEVPEPWQLAAAAIAVYEIDFDPWCA